MKKAYHTPKLKTQRMELGVFGNYSDTSTGNNGEGKAGPVDVIRDLRLHMD